MHIAVYLGASMPYNEVYSKAAEELGTWIATHSHTLVYGGSKVGLMGILASAALEAGGKVIGVEPQFFIDSAVQLEGLTELIVTQDMSERRSKMIELADVFIAFPGGIGTADEITEVITLGVLKQIDAKFGYFNINGYYDLIQAHYAKMVEAGFLTKENFEKIHFITSMDELEKLVEQ